jgi:hypothetical protein
MSCRFTGWCTSLIQPKASGAKLPSSVSSRVVPAPSVTTKRDVVRPGPISPGRMGGAGSANTAQRPSGLVMVGCRPAGTSPVRSSTPYASNQLARPFPSRATVQLPSRLMAASSQTVRWPPVAGSIAATTRPSVTLIDGPVGVAGGGVGAGVLAAGSAAGAGGGWALTVGSSRSAPPQLTSSTAATVKTAGARMSLLHRPPPGGSPAQLVGTVSASAMAASRSSADSSRYV